MAIHLDTSQTTAAAVLSAVTEVADVRDLAIDDADLSDALRRFYEQRS